MTIGFHAQQAPASWVAPTSFVIAILAIWPRRAWRATRHVVTVAHEGGHALVGLLVGRRLTGIRLHSDASGLTITSGRRDGLGIVATLAVGYPSPSLLGLGAAWLLANHYSHLVLLLSLVLLVGVGLSVRNAFGLLTIAVLGATVFAVLRWASPDAQSLFGWTAAWVLLLGGPRAVWELRRARRGTRPARTDADQLAVLTRLPATVWVGLFAVTTVATSGLGARWLILSTR